VDITTVAIHTMQQTTRASPVLRVILQHAPVGDSAQQIVQSDIFLNHLLLRMLCEAQVA
jgi:hypothetical protein